MELPPLSEPVPKDWVTIEETFSTVIASYQSHLGPEFMATPASTMTDGLIYLLIIRAPITKFQMLTLMGQFETGAHVKNPVVEIVPVKAFRLEPTAETGYMVVDGEQVAFGPIQGKILPCVGRVMAK